MEPDVLQQPIAPGSERLLRDYVLDCYEIYIVKQLTKATLENILSVNKKSLGSQSLVPTTMAQFRKLTGWLQGDVNFYLACCVPCGAEQRECPTCKKSLWNGSRPKHIFFTRSVKAWLNHLLDVPKVAQAISEYRKRKPRENVIGDVLDGKLTTDLVKDSMIDRTCYSHLIVEWLRLDKDLCFLANWDGFRPFKDQSAKSVDVANLILLSLPPALRTQPELIFTWFGLSAPVSNLNPFLHVALEEFFDSVGDFEDDDSAVHFDQ